MYVYDMIYMTFLLRQQVPSINVNKGYVHIFEFSMLFVKNL